MTTVAAKPLNLTVRFGQQERAKCPDCRCFMKESNGCAQCGRCGKVYDKQPDGLFVLRTT